MTDETPTTPPDSQPPKKQATTVTAGTLIMGTYEIEQLINSGGMGEVYRGRNIHNGEPVAIKIVLPALAHDPKIVALFQKESTVLSRLAHEAIVRYHVFTNDPTIGRPCMVMEFVSGQALAERIEQGPMPLEDVKTMLRRVASGLDKAHRAGVVHRDLSPDNVILEEGSVEHAKLIDFGIAKSSNFGSGTLLQGQFAGKFNWVSPEQLGAYGGQVDGRSDIYSLALITAAASKGEVLPMGASIVDAVSKRSSVPDLSGVDPALVPLLAWMLQPDPGQRAESMAKVIAALDNPALLPQPTAPATAVPDPNRTVIEPLPVATTPPPISSPPVQTAPPPATSWQARPQTTPPEGATIIAPQPVAPAEDEMASPFGAPPAAAKPAAKPASAHVDPVLPAKGGKGGLLAAVAVLALLGGGAGAWYGGLIGPQKQADTTVATNAPPKVETPPKTETAAPDPAATEKANADKAASDKAAAEKIAAEKAAAEKAAAEAKAAADKAAQQKAEAEKAAQEQAAAEKAAADARAAEEKAAQEKAEAEAKAATEAAAAQAAQAAQSSAEAATATLGIAQNAREEAEGAAKDVAAVQDSATAVPLAAKAAAAATRAETARAAIESALADIANQTAAVKTNPELAKSVADQLASAEQVLKQATEAAKGAADASTKAAAGLKALADAETAKAAEEKAKADALAADPLASQQAWLDGLTLPACTYLSVDEAAKTGFRLTGFAVDTAPLEKIAADWQAATKVKPDITTNLINEEQCAVLDFVAANRASASIRVEMAGNSVIKSGAPVEGTITGIEGRPFSVFLVNGSGGATNIAKWVTTDATGKTTFKFAPRLKEGAPPSPQLLMVVIGDEALGQALAGVKPNVIVRQLVSFIDGRLKDSGGTKALGLSWFRLEN